MTLRTRVMLPSFALAFATQFAAPVQAQPTSLPALQPAPHRVVEAYYSHYRFDVPGDRLGMNGIGARFMWRPSGADGTVPSFASRFAFGVFGEYAPDQDKGFKAGHLGVQSDMNVLATPLFKRVLPVLSLGAGSFWTDRVGPAIHSNEFSIQKRSIRSFALTPALGARVGLWRQLGLRADLRDLITFENETLHHVQYSAGLTLPF
jgi:hypothetical protein